MVSPAVPMLGHLGGERLDLVAYVVVLGLGVAWALRRMCADHYAAGGERRRDGWLLLGVLAVGVAISEPIDRLADRLFWVHMSQHVVLLTVAAPLIALGAPWRFLPPRVVSWWGARFGTRSTILPAAIAAWCAFNLVFLAFHVPVLYDAAIRLLWVHLIEHALFLVTAVWFWAVVFDARSFRTEPKELVRVGYVLGAAAVGWLLAIVLTFATEPIYREYARLATRPGGISALADQQLAAGVMLVPGSITFLLVAGLALARWLGTDAAEPPGASSSIHEESHV